MAFDSGPSVMTEPDGLARPPGPRGRRGPARVAAGHQEGDAESAQGGAGAAVGRACQKVRRTAVWVPAATANGTVARAVR